MPGKSEKLEELFSSALALEDAHARESFLIQSCGEDADLLERLRLLLRSNGPAEVFFRRLGIDSASDSQPKNDPTNGSSQDTERSNAKVPRRIDRFEILEYAGHGGMGKVYRARDLKNGLIVALKIPQLSLLGDPRLVKMFLREAKMASQLTHPNLVPIVAVGYASSVCYIATRWHEQGDLANWLTQYPGPHVAKQVVRFLRPLAEAIRYCHANNVMHLDLKPSNILLSDCRKSATTVIDVNCESLAGLAPHLADFGVAMVMDSEFSDSLRGLIWATPNYMSPEQAVGQPNQIDSRTDVFGIGLILFELLTGVTPYGKLEAIEIRKKLATQEFVAKPVSVKIPIDLWNICQKCLRRTSSARYQSVENLIADFDRYLNGQKVIATSERWPRFVHKIRSIAALYRNRNSLESKPKQSLH